MQIQTLSIIAGYIICILVGALGAIIIWRIADGTIDITHLISEANGDASMSRFQFLVFTFVIALSLFLVIVSSTPPQFPIIPGTILALLGISSSSYLVGKSIQFSDPAGLVRHDAVLTVSPNKPTVRVGTTQQFKANIPTNVGDQVKWQVVAGYGTINDSGLYTANLNAGPAAAGQAAPPNPPVHATIQVTSADDPDMYDLAVVTITL
jgi:hypothetical protein